MPQMTEITPFIFGRPLSIGVVLERLSKKAEVAVFCGVAPLGAFNAEVRKTPHGVLVLINSALLDLVDRTCTILAHLIDVTAYDENDSQFLRQRSRSSLLRLHTLTALEYVTHRLSKNSTTGISFTKPTPPAPVPAWLGGTELAFWVKYFLVAHECWHVFQPGFGKAPTERKVAYHTIQAWAEEMDADEFAARILLVAPSAKKRRPGAMWAEVENFKAEVRLAAPVIFLRLAELVRDVSTVSAHPFNQVRLSHPYGGQRITELKSRLIDGRPIFGDFVKKSKKSLTKKWFNRAPVEEELFRLEKLCSRWLAGVKSEVFQWVEHHLRGQFFVGAAKGILRLQPIADHHISAALFVLPEFLISAAAHPANAGYQFIFDGEGGVQQFDMFLRENGRRFRRVIDIPNPAGDGRDEGMRAIQELIYGTKQAEAEGYTELKKLVDHLIRSKHPPTMMAVLASMEVDLENYKEDLEDGATSEYARYNRLNEQRRRLSAAIGKQKLARPHAWEESRAQVPVVITVVMIEVIRRFPAGELTSNDIGAECKVIVE